MKSGKAKREDIQGVADALRRLQSQLGEVEATTRSAQEMLARLPTQPANDARAKPESPPHATDVKDYAVYSEGFFADVLKLLGGREVWKKIPCNRLEVHQAIQRGISSKALAHLVRHVTEIPDDRLFDIVGISRRTVQRRAGAPEAPLSQEQGSRLWKFAEILSMATELFGDQKAAERWLNSPAIALERHAPVDLMTTQAGAEMVEQLITRLEYGVYT